MTARKPVPMPETRPAAVEMPEADLSAARRRAERIRLLATTVTENLTKLLDLVLEAKASSDHVALGYASWTAYVVDLFGEEPLRLARDKRRELAAVLAGQGLSSRAIAPIVGVDHTTVARDVAAVADATPDVLVVEETLIEPPLVAWDAETGELTDADVPTFAPTPVHGLDGKVYPRKTAERKPTTPRAEVAVEDIVKRLESVAVASTEVSLLVFDSPDPDRAEDWARRISVATTALREFSEGVRRWAK